MTQTSHASLGNLSQFAIVDSDRISNLISSAGRSIHFCRAGWKMVAARLGCLSIHRKGIFKEHCRGYLCGTIEN